MRGCIVIGFALAALAGCGDSGSEVDQQALAESVAESAQTAVDAGTLRLQEQGIYLEAGEVHPLRPCKETEGGFTCYFEYVYEGPAGTVTSEATVAIYDVDEDECWIGETVAVNYEPDLPGLGQADPEDMHGCIGKTAFELGLEQTEDPEF